MMKYDSSVTLFLLIAAITLACTGKDKQLPDKEPQVDSAQAGPVVENVVNDPGIVSGEYLVGDGNMYIVRVGDTYELQDGQGKASAVIVFQGMEDSLSVYSNQDKSITFKINPNQKTGTYYASGEQLPVENVGEEIPVKQSE